MKTLATVVLAFLVSALIGAPATAQTTTESVEMGQAQYVVAQIKGEVAEVDGNYLLVKIAPNGEYRWFNVSPDRQFIIDGQSKAVGQLTPGTLLKATMVTKTQPVTLWTTTITNGTVLSASGRHVTVRLENGERRGYMVPDTVKFTVDGKPMSVYDLQKGMNVTATRVVSDPESEISTLTVVTGTAPK